MLSFSFVRPDQPVESARLHSDIQVTIDIGLSEAELALWMNETVRNALFVAGRSLTETNLSQAQWAHLAEEAIKQLIGG